jgi:hypothetical protein
MIASLAIGLALATAAPGQDAPASQQVEPPAAVSLEDVVVTGHSLETLVRDFVAEVGQPAARRGLARWSRGVCVGAVNFRPETAQFLVDRVSDTARELEVPAGEPGCKPNVLVIGAVDGAALASALVADRPREFDLRHNGTDAGSRAFRAFRTEQRPVRWWQISFPIDSDTGRRAVRLPGDISENGGIAVPIISVFSASRLTTQIRDDLVRVVVIVDVDQLRGASAVQLADYVAFISLAQVDPDADTSGYETILNLFENVDGAPDGLTGWDRSYLQALYRQEPRRINPNSQVDAVVADITRDRRAAATAEAEEVGEAGEAE